MTSRRTARFDATYTRPPPSSRPRCLRQQTRIFLYHTASNSITSYRDKFTFLRCQNGETRSSTIRQLHVRRRNLYFQHPPQRNGKLPLLNMPQASRRAFPHICGLPHVFYHVDIGVQLVEKDKVFGYR